MNPSPVPPRGRNPLYARKDSSHQRGEPRLRKTIWRILGKHLAPWLPLYLELPVPLSGQSLIIPCSLPSPENECSTLIPWGRGTFFSSLVFLCCGNFKLNKCMCFALCVDLTPRSCQTQWREKQNAASQGVLSKKVPVSLQVDPGNYFFVFWVHTENTSKFENK